MVAYIMSFYDTYSVVPEFAQEAMLGKARESFLLLITIQSTHINAQKSNRS